MLGLIRVPNQESKQTQIDSASHQNHLENELEVWFEFEVWCLKFEVEVWSWILKLKFVVEVSSWKNLKLKKFEVEEIWSWRNLELKKFEVEEI